MTPVDVDDAPQEGITLKTYNQSVESLEHEANHKTTFSNLNV